MLWHRVQSVLLHVQWKTCLSRYNAPSQRDLSIFFYDLLLQSYLQAFNVNTHCKQILVNNSSRLEQLVNKQTNMVYRSSCSFLSLQIKPHPLCWASTSDSFNTLITHIYRLVSVFPVRACISDFWEDLCVKGDYSLAAVYLLTCGRGRLLSSHR